MSYPLSVSALSDILVIESVEWGDQRNDELSGTGDGRIWSVQLAPPLWRATVTMVQHYHAQVKAQLAVLRRLQVPGASFLLVDPVSPYPAADPDGSILGSSSVTVGSIGSDRQTMSLSGLPGGYKLTAGDKGQISYGSPSKYYFFEVSEDVTGSSAFDVYPPVPVGISAGASVTLKKPACHMMIVPGSLKPGVSVSLFTSGLTFDCVQKP